MNYVKNQHDANEKVREIIFFINNVGRYAGTNDTPERREQLIENLKRVINSLRDGRYTDRNDG